MNRYRNINMRKLLPLILLFIIPLSVRATTIKETVAMITSMVPLNSNYGTLDALSYDESENEMVAVFSCSDEFLATFDQTKEMSLTAFVTGLLMASDPNLPPFNLAIIVRTPGNPKGKTFYEPDSKMKQLISFVQDMMGDTGQDSMERFLNRIQEAPMQCDPDGTFCFTLDFSQATNELVMNLQLLNVTDTEDIAYAADLLADALGKELANSLRMFEPLMLANDIGVRIDIYKGTANAPFKTIRYSAEQLFN